jgi:hypothetical protein
MTTARFIEHCVVKPNQTIWFMVPKRLQDNALEYAEHGGVRADTERKSEHCHESKAGAHGHTAKGVSNVSE